MATGSGNGLVRLEDFVFRMDSVLGQQHLKSVEHKDLDVDLNNTDVGWFQRAADAM